MTNPARSTMRDALWVSVILAAIVIFFHKFFFSGMIPLNSEWLVQNFYPWKGVGFGSFQTGYPNDFDPVLAMYPFKYTSIEMMRHCRLPLWNPYILCGAPLWGNNFATPLNPLNIIFFLTNFPQSWALFLFAQFAAAGIGTYLYCRELGMAGAGSAIASLAFTLNTAFLLLYQTVGYLGVFSWLPLALFLIERAIRAKSRLYALWAGLVIAFFFWCGIIQLAVYASCFSLAYLLFRATQACMREPRHAGTFAGLGLTAAAAAILFSLPELIVQAVLVANSTRTPGRYGMTILYPQMLITYLSPFFYGTKFDGWDIGHGTYIFNRGLFRLAPPYIGILPLFLSLFGFVYRKDADRFFYLLFSFGILVCLSLLGLPFISEPLLRLVPFFCSVDHYRLTTLYAFSLSIMAGWGYDGIMKARSSARLMRYAPFAMAVSVFVLFGLLDLFSHLSAGAVAGLMAAFQKMLPKALFDGSHSLKSIGLFTDYLRSLRGDMPSLLLRPETLRPAVLSVVGALLIALAMRKRRKTIIGFGMVALVGADLLSHGYAGGTYSRPMSVYPETPVVRFLRQDESLYRIAGCTTRTEPPHGDSFPPNTNMVFGLHDIRGYENLGQARWYHRFFRGDDPKDVVSDTLPDIHSGPILSFMNVKYLISGTEVPNLGWEKVYDREVRVYRNPKPLERAFLARSVIAVKSDDEALSRIRDSGFDPLNEVVLENDGKETVPKREYDSPPRIELYSPDEVRVALDGRTQGLLVLTDTYYPGWRAIVDGRTRPIRRVNHAFRGVVVERGGRAVHFIYRPAWLYEILYACLTVFAVMLVLTLLHLIRKVTPRFFKS